ncbi:MAG: isoleucine--tRNA ligase [Bacteroidota bacterium]
MSFTYPEHAQLDLAQTAQTINAFWKQHDIFQQSIQRREGQPNFTFYEGPPSANGAPGIHHVLPRTIKDIFCRYKTQKGFQVKRKGGWDTHGLPVELAVEKQLGITKADIGTKISIAAYNAQCRQTVLQYKEQWDALTAQMGYWLDTDQSYLTFDRNYIESLWNLLKQLHHKGLLYKGYTIQPYSPAAGTGLSTHELNQPGTYKVLKDISIVAQFQVTGTERDYFLAWTTTPWTLPANSALAVGEHIDYVKVRTFNPYTHQPVQVILAHAVVPRYFPTEETKDDASFAQYQAGDTPIPWKIVAHYSGKALIGKTYDQLLPYITPSTPAFRVIAGDFVTTDEGTGIVHIAPTFGVDDMRVAQQAGIPPITIQRATNTALPIVDRQGRFVDEIVDFAGQYVKEAYVPEAVRQQPDYKPVDVLLAVKLKKENKAFQVAKYEHSYPHCWRTDKPILYYPLNAWFIKTTAYKERLVALNKTIHWQPAGTGTGRFGNWLENLVDWNLSRDRYWGTPLPIWRTQDQKEEQCIGSLAELRLEVDKAVAAGLMKAPLPEDIDLHRPYVDYIVLVSPTGQPMYREPDLVDVWFDSGAMPYAQWHYPFEHQEIWQKHFPADFIAEGVDQTRGWFFTLHVLAVLLFDNVAFKHVIANGLVLDKQGRKMSKRLGNAIDPVAIMAQHGPDALRWYMISNANPWDNLRFNPQDLEEVKRRFFSTLHNIYSFFALYANIDQFNDTIPPVPLAVRPDIDRWMLSRLNSLIQTVSEAYEAYSPTQVARAIQDFVVDDLSNWYVRLNRKRFWKSEQGQDKLAAYQTLHTCLKTTAQLAAPIAPFYTEQLYQSLHYNPQLASEISVHLADFPKANQQLIDTTLEQAMRQTQKIVSLVHALRKKHQIKVRQPLAKLLIPVVDKAVKAQIVPLEPLIKAEVNVKHVTYTNDTKTVVTQKAKPNFKTLGKRYRTHMKALAHAVAQLGQEEIQRLMQEKRLVLALALANSQPTEACTTQEATTVVLTLDDVIITSEDIPGWAVAHDEGITVALDITIDNTLRQEGLARELVNRLQNVRKDQGLAVTDKIKITLVSEHLFIKSAVKQHERYICHETQALQLAVVDEIATGVRLDLDGAEVQVRIDRYG